MSNQQSLMLYVLMSCKASQLGRVAQERVFNNQQATPPAQGERCHIHTQFKSQRLSEIQKVKPQFDHWGFFMGGNFLLVLVFLRVHHVVDTNILA